jgi:hypothetical protein
MNVLAATRSLKTGKTPMSDLNLERFRKFAAEARSRPGFEATLFTFSWKTGKWTTGKEEKMIVHNGRKLAADIADLMHGYQRYYKETKQWDYRIVRVNDDVPAPKRDELSDPNEQDWRDGKDPWTQVRPLPLFDLETHESFVWKAIGFSEANAVSILTDAWRENIEAHPEDADQVPVCALDCEQKNEGNFNPLLDIVGWIVRPVAVRHIKPPAAAAIKLKSGNSGNRDIDDAIPF